MHYLPPQIQALPCRGFDQLSARVSVVGNCMHWKQVLLTSNMYGKIDLAHVTVMLENALKVHLQNISTKV